MKTFHLPPKGRKVSKGLILYPGAKVEIESYAPLARKIAESGYEVVIVKMPLNLAILGTNKAQKVMDSYNNIEHWVIGGHSLGGVAASNFARDNKLIEGVVFLASYPMGDELKELGKKVISIWGSKDGVVNFKSLVEQNKNFLMIQLMLRLKEEIMHNLETMENKREIMMLL